MTIYGVGYRALTYRPVGAAVRLRALVLVEFQALFRSRWGVAKFLACLLPSIVYLVMLLVQMGVLQFGPVRMGEQIPPNSEFARFLPTDRRFYLDPIIENWGLAPFLLISTLISSRAIAKDRAAGALELLWTRGITPRGYFLAKWLGTLGLLGIMCVLAPLLLWLLGIVLAPDWTLLERTWSFMPRTLAALVGFTLVLGYMPVAFSAIAGSPNLASLLWCMVVVGSTAVGHVLAELMRDPAWVPVLSLWDATATLARWVAGLAEPAKVVRGAMVNLVTVVCVLTVLMVRRMRLREAVS